MNKHEFQSNDQLFSQTAKRERFFPNFFFSRHCGAISHTACAAVLAFLPDVVAQAWLPSRPGGLQIVFPTQKASYIVLHPIVAYSFPALCKKKEKKEKTARDRTPVPEKKQPGTGPQYRKKKKKEKGESRKKKSMLLLLAFDPQVFVRGPMQVSQWKLAWRLLRWTIAVWWCGQHVSSWCRWFELSG